MTFLSLNEKFSSVVLAGDVEGSGGGGEFGDSLSDKKGGFVLEEHVPDLELEEDVYNGDVDPATVLDGYSFGYDGAFLDENGPKLELEEDVYDDGARFAVAG